MEINKIMKCSNAFIIAVFCNIPAVSHSSDLLEDGKAEVNFRYRIEHVDQENIEKAAIASTLLSRFKYETLSHENVNFGIEVDHVSVLGADKYNNTLNGKQYYPVIADPEGVDINQYWIKYVKNDISFSAGRQRINHNNQRFVGGVAWRQNEQTYDGYRIQWAPTNLFNIDYSLVHNVNRVFGTKSPRSDYSGNFHLLNTTFKLNNNHKFNFYGYLLDFKEYKNFSTKTFGADYYATIESVDLHATYAIQQKYKNFEYSHTLNYWAVDASLVFDNFKFTSGVEMLEGDGTRTFVTPFATLHKFQGEADQFLNTPLNGIRDYFGKFSMIYEDHVLSFGYHKFESYKDDINYGSEVNLAIEKKFSKKLNLLLKAASYNAEQHSHDTNKIWFQLYYKI